MLYHLLCYFTPAAAVRQPLLRVRRNGSRALFHVRAVPATGLRAWARSRSPGGGLREASSARLRPARAGNGPGLRHPDPHLPEPLTEDAPRSGATPLHIRPFEWDDFDTLFHLDAAARGPSPGGIAAAIEAFRTALRLPRADPERNVLLAYCGGRPCGYVRLDLELNIGRAVAWLRIVPGRKKEETARALVEAAIARARQTDASLLHVPIEGARERTYRDVLRAAGMRVVRRHWRMRRPAMPVDVPPVPDWIRVRPFEPGRDEPVLAELQNAVFAGSWGYSPNTVKELAARLALPGRGPGGVLFLEDGTGPVAYCWMDRDGEGCREADVIRMIGVRPGNRGRGLGRLIASLGIHLTSRQRAREVELEVDSANDGAVKLYRALAFERVSEVLWYARDLAG